MHGNHCRKTLRCTRCILIEFIIRGEQRDLMLAEGCTEKCLLRIHPSDYIRVTRPAYEITLYSAGIRGEKVDSTRVPHITTPKSTSTP